MRPLATLSILLIFLLADNCLPDAVCAFSSDAKATLVVVDEENHFISGAKAGFSYDKNRSSGVGTDVELMDGITDSNGRYTATHNNDSNVIFYSAEKNGYYYSNGRYNFTNKSLRGWEPWNPEIKVVMRKIVNPVPMYARKILIDLPILGKNVGYDLIICDFTPPYGQGRQADIVFMAEKNVVNKEHYASNLFVRFTNKHDGIMLIKENLQYGSEFKLPRTAPSEGYASQVILTKSRTPNNGVKVNFAEDDNYVFRIRSEEEGGTFKRAMSGKILGPISFGNITRRPTVTISFKYFLNPHYTSNLEFDTKHNLFGNLFILDQVSSP